MIVLDTHIFLWLYPEPEKLTPESLSMHGGPADRIIAATTLVAGCWLATVDAKLQALPFLPTVQ